MIRIKTISKFDYLYNRPFLCISHFKQPAAGRKVKTERKDWMKDTQNVTIKEQPLLVDRVTYKHMRQSSVIIDILGDCIIKNRLRSNEESDSDLDPARYDTQILEYFKGKYADIIEQATHAWKFRVTGSAV